MAKSVKQVDSGEVLGPESYFNRELSWLQFNHRVLAQAADERLPLLERVKFLAIAGSNLDEFFMKRIGGLKQQIAAGVDEPGDDGRTSRQQIAESYQAIAEFQREKEPIITQIWQALQQEGISILPYAELDAAEKDEARQIYYDTVFPLVTPQSIDPAHPFPFISNLSLNLLVTLRYPGDEESSLARVKVPISAGAPRFMRIGDQLRFVLLEEVMARNLDLLFPGMEVLDCELFRVTRNANTEANMEHADDLLAQIESALRDRKFAPIVRLQVRPSLAPLHRGRLAAELGLDAETDVFDVDDLMGLRDLWELVALDMPGLKLPAHHPVDHPGIPAERPIFHTVREVRTVLLQHPYEAFSTSVERFLREAASDPKVRGIKMTLYRTSPDSEVINYLIQAANNGKQVAAVVELKASFDEASNIRLAERMEEAGIHVTYGVVGLKTHAKIILVVRKDYKGLRRYVHIGTGNYHPGTSRIYSDLGLLIYDKDIGQDITELFNYLTTGFTPKRKYSKLLVAPKLLKKALLEKIEREIEVGDDERPGLIRFKINALEDAEVIQALYRASQAGVQVELLVRDICRLRPGVPGLSENIRVVSIVGRFLEHARIYYFGNGGNEEYFIGSADAMKRNLENRVEVLVPVENSQLREELHRILNIHLQDRANAWELQADGSYRRVDGVAPLAESSQEQLIVKATRRYQEANRLRRRKVAPVPLRTLD